MMMKKMERNLTLDSDLYFISFLFLHSLHWLMNKAAKESKREKKTNRNHSLVSQVFFVHFSRLRYVLCCDVCLSLFEFRKRVRELF